MKNYTDITILVDRSGSMAALKAPMESALDELITKHAEIKSTRVSLIFFDSINRHDVRFTNVPAYALEKSELVIKPRGNTPLYDATSEAITATGKRLASLDESERPDQVLFIIITDGEENSSTQASAASVRSMIQLQTDTYKWQFTYLGANQDALFVASRMGIQPQFALNYQASGQGIGGASASLASNTFKYASNTGEERTRSTNLAYTKEQREAAMAGDTN